MIFTGFSPAFFQQAYIRDAHSYGVGVKNVCRVSDGSGEGLEFQ